MKITTISNVAGCGWAGSEELWLAAAMEALWSGHSVTACINKELYSAAPLKAFVSQGGNLIDWTRFPISRFEQAKQALFPQFTLARLGYPDVLLVSLGALPAMNYVPGLVNFLLKTTQPFVILCQFNTDSLGIAPHERESVRHVLERASSVVFVSEQNRVLARRQYRLELPNSHVIYNPIRIHLESPLPYNGIESEVVFACVARFETLWKGQDLLIEILASDVWKSRKWKLKFFGEGPDLQHVRNYTKMLGLQERVTFEGYVRDVRQIWSDSHLMILPSRGEGTPLAILEAMMCGRPVVTTDAGGNLEVLEEGVTGWIADAATARSFALALERAWVNKSRWAEMGQVAHAKAIQLAEQEPSLNLLQVLIQSTKAASSLG